MTDMVEQRQMVTRAFDMLQAEGFDVSCDPDLLDPSLPPPGHQGLSLGDRLGHLTQSIQSAAHTSEAVTALSELTAPGDGVLQRVVESLNTTAEWWEGLGEPADPHYANRLRYIAKKARLLRVGDSVHARRPDRPAHRPPRQGPGPGGPSHPGGTGGAPSRRRSRGLTDRTAHDPSRAAVSFSRTSLPASRPTLVRTRSLTAAQLGAAMSRTSRTIPALDRPSPPACTGWICHAAPEHDPPQPTTRGPAHRTAHRPGPDRWGKKAQATEGRSTFR